LSSSAQIALGQTCCSVTPRRFLAAILGVLSLLGCNRVAPAPARTEPSLAEQVAAVRDGRSGEIRLAHTVVTDDDLSQLDGLEDRLARVNFSRTEITNQGLARLCQFPHLMQLRLASTHLDDHGMASLADLKELRHLHLIDAPITDAGLEHLYGLTNLESLYLDRPQASDEGLGELVAALPGVHIHIDNGHYRLDPHREDHDHPAGR
jgi:hypothetical protein